MSRCATERGTLVSEARCAHDWRVDPNQVIVSMQGVYRVRVGCSKCPTRAYIHTSPNLAADPEDRETWRSYKWKPYDRVYEDGTARSVQKDMTDN